MPEALHIHRRVLTEIEVPVVQQIHYSFTKEGLVDIHKMTAHYMLEDGTVSPSFFNSELDYAAKLSLLSILVEDGAIEIP